MIDLSKLPEAARALGGRGGSSRPPQPGTAAEPSALASARSGAGTCHGSLGSSRPSTLPPDNPGFGSAPPADTDAWDGGRHRSIHPTRPLRRQTSHHVSHRTKVALRRSLAELEEDRDVFVIKSAHWFGGL